MACLEKIMSNKVAFGRCAPLTLAIFIFASACNACGSKDSVNASQGQLAEGCKSDQIASSFREYLKESDSERLESGRVRISGLFDRCPNEVITFAIAEDLGAGQIGRLISALPSSYVDDPCASEAVLLAKQRALVSARQTIDNQTYDGVSAFLQRLISVDALACRGHE